MKSINFIYNRLFCCNHTCYRVNMVSEPSASSYSWPSRAWKKILLAFLSTFWHPCTKCILMCFKKDRGGCQVWKCPKVPELGQRSTECKFLYIRQILAFLSISYPKLWFKVMQNLFWILQPCYINKQHHQGMTCVWIKGHLSAKSVKIVAIFFLNRGKNSNFMFPSILMEENFYCYWARCVSIMFEAIIYQVSCGQIFIIGM